MDTSSVEDRESSVEDRGASAPAASLAADPPERAASRAARWMRAMAIVRWALLAAVSLAAVYSVVTIWRPVSSAEAPARADRFYCSMHPEIRSPDPGTCPICHMDLVPIPEGRSRVASTSTPAGGPVAAAEAPAPADSAAPGTAPPGLSPVTLSVERQQLFGIATAPVVEGPLSNGLRLPASVEAPRGGVAEVRVRAAGFVESVAVRETGVRVKKGQVLAWMFSPDIYRAEEELAAAHRFSQGPAAAAAGGTAADMVAAARRGLELLGVSQAEIDDVIRAGHASRNVAVRAPSSGVVTRSSAVLGMRATPSWTPARRGTCSSRRTTGASSPARWRQARSPAIGSRSCPA